jgi:hypothetical protein
MDRSGFLSAHHPIAIAEDRRRGTNHLQTRKPRRRDSGHGTNLAPCDLRKRESGTRDQAPPKNPKTGFATSAFSGIQAVIPLPETDSGIPIFGTLRAGRRWTNPSGQTAGA